MAAGWPLWATAQSAPAGETPKAGEVDRSKLTDSERARRDADRVFNFIKFHAVKPAAAPAAAPAAPRPAVAARPAPAPSAVQAASPTATPVGGAGASAANVAANTAANVAAGISAPAAASDPRTLPPAAPDPLPAVATQPEPAAPAAPEPAAEEEDVGLKMVKYVAPELNAKAIASVTTPTAKVRVRFMVMPNGSVGKATAAAGVPRALALVATRAVEQWRFDPIKEAREVEVEVDFKFD